MLRRWTAVKAAMLCVKEMRKSNANRSAAA
jgi:hypothetical protein